MIKYKYPNLRHGLVGAWCPSLGATGYTLRDQSGYGNHGTLTNMDAGSDWVASGGKVSLDFDGVDDNVTIPVSTPDTTELTLSLWVNAKLGTSGFPRFLTRNDTQVYGLLYITSTNRIQFSIGNVNLEATVPNIMGAGWIHVAGSYVSGQFKNLYLNGKLIASATQTYTIPANSGFPIVLGNRVTGDRQLLGQLDDINVYHRALTAGEIATLASRRGIAYEIAPRQRSYFALAGAAPAGPTYTLTADAGSFALTGIDAGLQASRLLTADAGSFALTGIDAGLLANRSLTADAGSFTLTGIDAGLIAGRRLTADLGTFALTGIDAGILARRLLTADAGSFALTGIDANLLANRLLSAGVGEFVLTGINVDLTYSGAGGPTYTLTCDAGSFTLTGINAGLLASRRITADAGSFALTGIDAAVLANRLITADTGAFALTGIDAAFVVNRRLAADTGAFVLTGIDANLTYSGATSSSASIYYYLMMGS